MSEELLKVLVVTGTGIEQIEATIAQVSLAVEAKGTVATEVQQEIANQSSAVVDLLKTSNVEQLKTTGINLRTTYFDEGKVVRYFGNNKVNFRVSIDRVGILLNEVVKTGVSRIDGVSFTTTPEVISNAKKEALRKATIDAKTKAEVVLSTLDFTLKEIISIEVDNARVREFKSSALNEVNRRRSRRVSEESAEMPVVGGELTVNAAVTLQISY